MPERVVTVRFRRIVAGLPSAGDPAPLARLAGLLAAAGRAELSAFMLQDTMLARLAQLPVARHLAFGTAASLPLTPDMLRLSMAASLRRVQGLLARLPETANLTWSLEAATDGVQAPEVAADDLLLLSAYDPLPETWHRGVAPPGVLVAALVLDEAIAQRRMVVVDDGSAEAERALAMAAMLADRRSSELIVLVPQTLPESAHREIQAALQARAASCHVEPVDRLDPETIAAAARRVGAGLILLPADPETMQRLQSLLGLTAAAAT